jgi:hypothetical protein
MIKPWLNELIPEHFGADFIAAGLIVIGLSMFANFTNLLSRLRLRWEAVLAALVTALPVLLDQLGVIDLKPLLMHLGMSPEWAAVLVGLMPFVLAFLRPLVHVKDAQDQQP